MYCSKCGKQVRSGDVYCSGCGSRLTAAAQNTQKNKTQKNGKSRLLMLLCAAALILAAVNIFGSSRQSSSSPSGSLQERESVTLKQPQASALPQEPGPDDTLEDSTYSDGTLRRSVEDYGDIYVTDYRPDGTLLRETILYYSSGSYSGKRVKNCDAWGNPTDETETLTDGTVWLSLTYSNRYDDQGRPLQLAQYNRAGNPLYIYSYSYNADGSYTMELIEYRGPAYEYEFEENPAGTTTPWTSLTTTFNSEGELIDQMIHQLDGAE